MGENGGLEKLAPRWDSEDADSLDVYLDDLSFAKTNNFFKSDALLIWSSLRASNKTHILKGASAEQKADLTKFAEFLRERYDISSIHKRSNFNKIKQQNEEREAVFLSRVESEFYKLTGNHVPGTKEGKDTDQIKLVFIQGLNHSETRRHLLMQIDSITYDKLAQTARSIREGCESAEQRIYAINEAHNNQMEERLNKKMEDLVLQTQETYQRQDNHNRQGQSGNRDSKRETRRCYKCNYIGHLAKDCRASERTIAKNRSRRNSRSNSQGRDNYNNRGRSPHFRTSTPYRNRSGSHGRYYSRSNSRDRQNNYKRSSNNQNWNGRNRSRSPSRDYRRSAWSRSPSRERSVRFQ